MNDTDTETHDRPRRNSTNPPLAMPRVATRDLTLDARLDDGWHKLDGQGNETACGIAVNPRLVIETRVGRTVEHPLAEKCDCWTRKDWERANNNYRTKFHREYERWSSKKDER